MAASPSEIAGLGKDIDFYVGKSEVEKGGPGSGHWRHAGRKGKKGGSAPSKVGGVAAENFDSAAMQYGIQGVFNKSSKYKKDGGAYTLRDREGKNWGYVVKNRETGEWELRVNRVEYGMGLEEPGKFGRRTIAEFTYGLGKHDDADSAMASVTDKFAIRPKVSRVTRYRKEESIPEKIDTSEWTGKNYQKKFYDATGHSIGSSVDVPQAKAIAESLQGAPQSYKPVTFHTFKSDDMFREVYNESGGKGMESPYAFYRSGKASGSIYFSRPCSDMLQIGMAKGTVAHEYAHAFDDSARKGIYNHRSMLKKPMRLFQEAKSSGRLPTEYAGTNPKEFFAEMFEEVTIATQKGEASWIKSEYPEGHEMLSYVIGDRMPEGWK